MKKLDLIVLFVKKQKVIFSLSLSVWHIKKYFATTLIFVQLFNKNQSVFPTASATGFSSLMSWANFEGFNDWAPSHSATLGSM